ncbi:MAG TPA: AraC family transcriptional regulator [Telluria sp.]|nr:AraC family transcriptional regulator [Telluria sp.]
MSQDILSDVLRHIRLRGAVYYDIETGGQPWAAEAPPSQEIAAAVMPACEHVIEYHMLIAGACWGGVVGDAPSRLATGDIILFPHGDPHVISSAPGMRAPPNYTGIFDAGERQLPFSICIEGSTPLPEGARPTPGGARMICGFFGCDLRPFNPLVASLPRVLHLPRADDSPWLGAFLSHAAGESAAKRPGAEAMLERMSEMIFISAIRRHVESLPEDSLGWLAGVRDRMVGRALALIHADPAHPWTVDELGRRIGLSRSALHERFAELLQMTPMQYVANWRMQVAASRLRASNVSVVAVAQEVGYESETAFVRAFRRALGMPPATWRRHVRGEAGPAAE